MALIKVGVSETRSFTPLPAGKYEVFVDTYDDPEIDASGNQTSRIMFRVRKDIDPVNGGRTVFSNINSSWGWLINGLSKAVGIAPDTDYDSLADFLLDVKGKSLVINVRHKPNPKDATKVYVNVTDFFPTTYPAYIADATDDSNII